MRRQERVGGNPHRAGVAGNADVVTASLSLNSARSQYIDALTSLQSARVTVHPDNRTIFDEIAASRADVMITDDVEVEVHRAAYFPPPTMKPGTRSLRSTTAITRLAVMEITR